MVPLDFFDVWGVETFPQSLRKLLDVNSNIIKNYISIENQIFLEHDLGRKRRQLQVRPDNPHVLSFYELIENINSMIQPFSIRGFHYTRLTDTEVESFRIRGVFTSDPTFLKYRLTQAVSAALISQEIADELYESSPLLQGQFENRRNMFWMASDPIKADDLGVVPLLSHWGGEVVYMYVRDKKLISILKNIGRPRIIEIIAPLSYTSRSYNAAESIFHSYAIAVGCLTRRKPFDFYLSQPVGPEAVFAVHTVGEDRFATIGSTYPDGYASDDPDYWFKLTGERY